ncbi:MAG: glycosyltransferase [Anaerolineae bacterium]
MDSTLESRHQCLVWDNPSVGSGQYLRYLLPALLEADDDLEITLISPKPFQPIPDPHPHLKLHHGLTPVWRLNLAKVWFEQMTFPRACRRLGVDLAHVPYFGSPLAPSVPTIVTIHDLIPMVLPEYRGGFLVRLYTSLVAAAAPQAKMILADSEASKRDIVQRLAVPAEQVQVVYLAPALIFSPPKAGNEIIAIKEVPFAGKLCPVLGRLRRAQEYQRPTARLYLGQRHVGRPVPAGAGWKITAG